LAACGGDDGTSATDATEEPMEETSEEAMDEEMGEIMALPTDAFGPACAGLPADGEGSAEGMMDDPVATAASNNPELSTLVELVGQAELVDTLNSAEALTVFAPANSAFEDLQASDPELYDMVASDPALLADVLTYHVVEGQLDAPALAEAGAATTLQGDELTVAVDGESVMVEADGSTAMVVCGNVATANATVHVIDTVLLPDVG
ncbi:MAG: fasciclin domain-containing protein, partial [Egicoccus sp.]